MFSPSRISVETNVRVSARYVETKILLSNYCDFHVFSQQNFSED